MLRFVIVVSTAACAPSFAWAALRASDDPALAKATFADVAWWSQFMREMGWPAAFVLAAAFVLWRIGKWVRPWLEKVAEAHLDLVEHLRGSQDKIVESVDRMCRSVETQSEEFRAHREWSRVAVDDIKREISRKGGA